MILQRDSRLVEKKYPDHSTFESESMANNYYYASTPGKKLEFKDNHHAGFYKGTMEEQTPEPISHDFNNDGDIELHSLRRYFKSQNSTCPRNHQDTEHLSSYLKNTFFENEILSFKEQKTKKIKKNLHKKEHNKWDSRSMRFSQWEQNEDESCEDYDDLDLRSNFAELGEDFDAPFFLSENEDPPCENPTKEDV